MKLSAVLGAALLIVAPNVPAQDAAARSLAATCANCHGPQGRSASTTLASLAGRPKTEIVEAMQSFKAGSRPATVMHQLAKGYTDQQIETIAGFFAGQKR